MTTATANPISPEAAARLAQLNQGINWTPALLVKLRELAGEDGRPLPRVRMAEMCGTTERSLIRWEDGTKMGRVYGKALTAFAIATLSDDRLAELLATP